MKKSDECLQYESCNEEMNSNASYGSGLTFIISTINDGIYNIEPYQISGAQFIIIHQYENSDDLEKYFNFFEANFDDRFEYYPMKGRGLCKSRNYGLKVCRTRYAYILDDDVGLASDAAYIVLHAFAKKQAAALVFPMARTPKGYGDKNLIKFRELKFLDLAKIKSVEMAFDLSRFSARFDESFGLGTDLPSGEEFIIMSDAYREGLKVFSTGVSVVSHDGRTSGTDFFSSREKVLAKKQMFRRISGKKFSLWSFLFFIKKTPVLLENRKLLFFVKNYFL